MLFHHAPVVGKHRAVVKVDIRTLDGVEKPRARRDHALKCRVPFQPAEICRALHLAVQIDVPDELRAGGDHPVFSPENEHAGFPALFHVGFKACNFFL